MDNLKKTHIKGTSLTINLDNNALIYMTTNIRVARDSVVSKATRYGLSRPGIESRTEHDFLHPSRPETGHT